MSLWSVDPIERQRFLLAYIECALWSSTGDDDVPLDRNFDADCLAPETLVHMREDCNVFVRGCRFDLMEVDAAQAGHDFWLTRNHHGAGFWDRGNGSVGEKLSAAAHTFPDVDLYVGDHGLLYLA